MAVTTPAPPAVAVPVAVTTRRRPPALSTASRTGRYRSRSSTCTSPTGTGPFPVMIYLHSGGWIAGNRSVIPDFLLAQVDRGIALVSIDYRLVTTAPDGSFVNSFPVPDTDVDRAVRFVKAHASTWNLDPRRGPARRRLRRRPPRRTGRRRAGVFVDPTLPPDSPPSHPGCKACSTSWASVTSPPSVPPADGRPDS